MSTLARYSLKLLHQHEISRHPQSQPHTAEQQRTFTCFLKLPIEIRFKIWKLLAPDSRNIDVGVECRSPSFQYYRNLPYDYFRSTACNQAPRVFHINQESRNLMLESYKLKFDLDDFSSSDYKFLPEGTIYCSGLIYVNWERDTICPIGVNDPKGDWMPELFEHPQICNVALNVRELLNPARELRSDGCLNIRSLFGMPNLEEVIFYCSDPSPQRVGVVDMIRGRGLRLGFEDIDEKQIVSELCRMSSHERPSMSYLLAARKTVYKDYDVLIQKRKARDELVKKGEEVPSELKTKIIDRILEMKRPVVRLAYLTVGGNAASLGSEHMD